VAVDEQGDLCWRNTYSPYGDKSLIHQGNSSNCGLIGEERGFTGHTQDFESGLVYAQQRYYDPTIGRFLSIDPISINTSDVKTINRYSYAANSPYRYTDPTGESITDFLKTAWGGVVSWWETGSSGLDSEQLSNALIAGYEEGGMAAFNALIEDLDTLTTVTPAGLSRKAAAKAISIAKNSALKEIRKQAGKCSFSGETLVLTDSGLRPIAAENHL